MLAASAEAPPMQAVISAKSRSLEIEITADQRLRTDPRLYESILTDAKRLTAKRQQEAEKYWRDEKVMFQHGAWAFERGYYFDAAAGPYIGLSILDYSYSGGAHPNQRTTSILWDRDQGKRVSIAVLFRETKPDGPTMTALAKLIREEVAREKRERNVEVDEPLETDLSLSAIKADLTTFGAPILVASTLEGKLAGIDFHFSAYDVGAYAEGAYGAYLPWRALEPYLTERARALFGGARKDESGEQKN